MLKIKELIRFPVTLSIILLCLGMFFMSGPETLSRFEYPNASLLEAVLLPVRLLYASFLHTDIVHLGLNLAVWSLLGMEVEPEVGSSRFVLLYVFATLLGGAVEGAFFDLSFVGLSAACFALLAWIVWNALARTKGMRGAIIAIGIIAGILLVETLIAEIVRAGSTAYGAHVGGSVAGLFAALGLGHKSHNGMTFRPMKHGDVSPVLDIIYDFDEDDGEEAEESFERGLQNKYIIEIEGRVAAMSGFSHEDQAQGVAWLSWTYVHPDYQRHGVAFYMMQQLRDVLEKGGYRKIFIATSDYVDEDTGEDVYAPARKFYQSKLNARREIVVKDYYDVGESKYVYSLPVIDVHTEPAPMDDSFHPQFVDLDLADESETGYVILWDESQQRSDQTVALKSLIDKARSKGAHAVFLTLTPTLSHNAKTDLTLAGFTQIGKLSDYYAPGVDDIYWALYFDGAS